MTMARLSASLLAKKGAAFPLANAYANPHLDPLPGRREAAVRPRRPGGNTRCRIEPELYTRLRILAARQGRALRAVLEDALKDHLAANGVDCPCLRDRQSAAPRPAGGACCKALG
jgi:hypothetical protein